MSGFRLRGASFLAIIGIIALSCGGAPATTTSSPTGAPSVAATKTPIPIEKVTLRLPFTMAGYDDPLVLAKERGYFTAAGFDVSIEEGKGSPTSAQLVANGSDDFGFVDVSAVASLIAKGANVKFVGVFQQVSALSFVYRPPLAIASVQDLVGKDVLWDGSVLLLPAVLAKNSGGKIGMKDLKVTTIQSSAYQQAFLTTPGSILVGNLNSTFQAIKLKDPTVKATLFSDLGVNVLSFGLIASNDKIKNNPDQVRRFVSAVVKGWEDSVKDPKAAVDASIKHFPTVDRVANTGQLEATLSLLQTAASKGKVLGWSAPSDWEITLTLLKEYGKLESTKATSDYFTNEFLPSR